VLFQLHLRWRPGVRGLIATVAALGAGIGLAQALTTCGNGDEAVPPQAWAASVCHAVQPWSTDLRRLRSRTENKLRAGRDDRDAGRVKTDLITLLSGMTMITDTAIRRVQDAGVPAVDDGSRIAAGFLRALRTARRSFTEGRNAVAALPTDDRPAFYRGVSAASKRIGRQNDRTFDSVSSPRLDAAFKSVTGCHI
jgi:hypothetical protein